MRRLILFLFFFTLPVSAALTPEQRARIDELAGAKGTYTAEEDTHRVAFPRNEAAYLQLALKLTE